MIEKLWPFIGNPVERSVGEKNEIVITILLIVITILKF